MGSRVAWGDSERLECGKGGCGLGEMGSWWGGGGGFSLGWSEFSHLTRVEATRPCQADDITLQECLPPLLAQEALCGGAPPPHPPSPLIIPSPLLTHSDSSTNPVISYLCLSDSSAQLFSSSPSFCLHLSGLFWLSFSLGLFRVCPLLSSPKSF